MSPNSSKKSTPGTVAKRNRKRNLFFTEEEEEDIGSEMTSLCRMTGEIGLDLTRLERNGLD